MANQSGVWGDRELVAALHDMANLAIGDIDESAEHAMQPMIEETEDRWRPFRRRLHETTFPQDRVARLPLPHLDKAVVMRKKKGTKQQRTFWLSVRRRAINLAHLLEFGTAPHYQPKMKIMHPGIRPRPGMTPAYETYGDDVVERMGEALWERMRDRAITYGRKAPKRRP